MITLIYCTYSRTYNIAGQWAYSTIAATCFAWSERVPIYPCTQASNMTSELSKSHEYKTCLGPTIITTTTTNLHDHHHAPGPLSLCTTLQRPPNPQRPLKEWSQPQWPFTTNHYFYHHHLLYNCKNRVVTFLTQCTRDSSFIAFLLPTSFTFIIWDSVYTL